MSGSEVRSPASTAMPLPISRPAASASWVFGRDADADDHRVGLDLAAVGQPYPAGPAAAPVISLDLDAEPQVDAVLAVQVGEDLRRPRRPSTRSSGSSAVSSTVTSAPAARAAAAASRPIHPAPMTATRDAVWKAALIWSLSPARAQVEHALERRRPAP